MTKLDFQEKAYKWCNIDQSSRTKNVFDVQMTMAVVKYKMQAIRVN